MTTFTASEAVAKLRDRFASGNDVPVPDVRLTRAEFDVIADRLEADEKAVPVGWRYFDGGVGYQYFDGAPYAVGAGIELLYLHPAPADAERLSEALRNMLDVVDPAHWPTYVRDAKKALAAHSAQAQPPATRMPGELAEPSTGVLNYEQELSFAEGWNACRKAMLAAQENHNG